MEAAPMSGFTDMYLFFKSGSALHQQGAAQTRGFTPAITWGSGVLNPGDVVGVAIDTVTNNVNVFLNGILAGTTVCETDLVGAGIAAIGGANNITNNFGQQPFVASNVTHDLDKGTVEIGGVTYNTLYQTFDQWATFGALLYDENNGGPIAQSQALQAYGSLTALPEAGLQPLTEQPAYQVAAYVQQDDGAYQPIESAEPSKAALASTQEALADTQQELMIAERKFSVVMERNKAMRDAMLKAGVEAPPVDLDIDVGRPGASTMPIEPESDDDFNASGTSAAILPATEE